MVNSVSKIKVSELFYSLQGEGMFVGVPSIFLRTFGCNFTCSGFGMPQGEVSKERDIIALTHKDLPYKNYNDLPLVSTGCDSYASWDVRFKNLSPVMETKDIVDKMLELLPDHQFNNDKHLIITGGEPLLGWQRSYPDLIDECINNGLTDITFETNGTQVITHELGGYLTSIADDVTITFSVSPKLPVSGERWEDAIKPDVVAQYSNIRNSNLYLKFVVASAKDIDDVRKAIFEYEDRPELWAIPVYLMPVGGTNEGYQMNERNVADFCRDNGYRFSPRLQVPLYKNAWGT
jgi:organic radical activating enzyme